ncbi:hypothetical protein ACFQ4L_10545 [Lapidilactobacillus mulanensis]|uniref:Uncharacterized protein n=1 Tax=Lapidilactobacillus mulanensis TaxID=2485999 RepID=A0ABW4DTF0_9LACO|nr:hypothetical protein [Lapidilactobacillus mulanensis]
MTREEMIEDIMEWRPDTRRSTWERKSEKQLKANWVILNSMADREADEILSSNC